MPWDDVRRLVQKALTDGRARVGVRQVTRSTRQQQQRAEKPGGRASLGERHIPGLF